VNLWRSRLRLYQKHYPPMKLRLARVIVQVGMRRQIGLARISFAEGQLSDTERDALIEAYRTIITL
jgi:hypothetical protein